MRVGNLNYGTGTEVSKYVHEHRKDRWLSTGGSEGAMGSVMSTKDLAEYLDVPVNTIYQWRVKKTGPPGIRVGRHLRWRREDVERWLDEHGT